MGRLRSPVRLVLVLALGLVPMGAGGAGLASERPGGGATGFVPVPAGSRTLATEAREAMLVARLPVPSPSSEERSTAHLLVRVERALPLSARPGGGRRVGIVPAGSRYYGTPIVAWVLEVSGDGRFGRVSIPYSEGRATGWVRLRGLERLTTRVSVVADLSQHRIEVRRGERVLFSAPAATGAHGSPTPPGRYFVTDRVAFPAGGVLGTFAFGVSGIQPRLPAGWTGGDQLAIHGTNAPWTIGTSSSAGCLRVSERVLDRLRPLLRLGTPVIVRR